jgi:predicted ATP-grasp superfamily ATP-dependent carboligase
MADRFRSFDDLLDALADRAFGRPPALVSNAHVTGLGVARALAAHDVPVIALDQVADGAGFPSDAVDLAGRVTYPLDDREGFRRDVEAVADALDHDPVAFACMDEWVHAYADTEPDGVVRPFAGRAVVDAVLDKTNLYALAERLDVPYPETYRVAETVDGGEGPPVVTAAAAADELGFPLVVKPALKREFEAAVGTNVVEVDGRDAFLDVVERAADEGIRVMAQEAVPVAEGEDRSLASYVGPDGDALALVGNARVRHPPGYGTSCVVDRVAEPAVRERALSVLEAAGYHGISESEFVYDEAREEYVLLDVNTRPWKWIGMPVAAGYNLPMAAYADATGDDYALATDAHEDLRWVYLPDYLERLATGAGADVLTREEWLALASGAGPDAGVVAGVFDPDDPGPTHQVLETTLGFREYYCAC